MKKNVVTIIFLFSLIFVTLMFGQEIEGFDSLPHTQTENGTYFTKETGGVSVFSAFGDFSQKINGVGLGQAKTDLQSCLTDATKTQRDKEYCYTNYSAAIQTSINNADVATLETVFNRNNDMRVSNAVHESTKNLISETNQSNRNNQLDLDRKMSEMLTDKSGIKLESATKQSSALYISILWTVLAATALYFIFIRI
jgi:hypothetical protein